MKNRRPMRILLTSCIICLVVSITTGSVLAYIERYGWEENNEQIYFSNYISQVKIQADAVYIDDDQGGVVPFGIWVKGKSQTGDPQSGYAGSSILIKLYISTEYDVQEINWRTGSYSHYTYWDPSPLNFMTWQGLYEYGYNTPSTWRWTVGANVYGFSMGISVTGNPVAGYGSGSGTSGDYRYIGWFESSYILGPHEFTALLKPHLVNDIARDWAKGIWYESWPIERITKITKIHVKLVFEYRYRCLWWWQYVTAHTHIMGDGTPAGDLNYIPLVSGSVP